MITCDSCTTENEQHQVACVHCGASLEEVASRALIGTVVLGIYQIVDVLGQGGMSVVYKGKHKMTDQLVALKILPPELAVHSGIKTRFLEEAKALARLEHANIVHLYNFGEEGGRFVLAMQYVEGDTFEKKILSVGRMEWRDATRITCEVLKALEYAHGRGVVHRDIKPSNILVRASDGAATVMDFGIAKMTESSRLTSTGQTMGTVRYMSPEQVRGASVDARTDVYSLGITIYEALVGDTPFDGNTHFEIMSKHLSEAPLSIRARGVELPADLDLVILKSIAKAPEQRYQSADEFRLALERVLAGDSLGDATRQMPAAAVRPQTPAPVAVMSPRPAPTGIASSLEPSIDDPSTPPVPRRRTGLWIGLALAVLAAGAGVIVLLKRGGDAKADSTADLPPKPGTVDTPQPPDLVVEWPEPVRLAALAIAEDQKFEGPEQVRVMVGTTGATIDKRLDAAKLAKSTVAARERFIAWVGLRQDARVEVHPMNLIVVAPKVMCDKGIWVPDEPPVKCLEFSFRYEPVTRTLFVANDASIEVQSIPEGVATHLCRTTPELHHKECRTILDPYFDELEQHL